MKHCPHQLELESWFDGQPADPAALRAHLEECAACQTHLKFLELTRERLNERARELSGRAPDPERFIAELRERTAAPSPFRGARWALLSLAAAAFIVAVSVFSMVTPQSRTAEARSTVQSAATDIEGATTETYHADDGTAIVWVNVPEGDLW